MHELVVAFLAKPELGAKRFGAITKERAPPRGLRQAAAAACSLPRAVLVAHQKSQRERGYTTPPAGACMAAVHACCLVQAPWTFSARRRRRGQGFSILPAAAAGVQGATGSRWGRPNWAGAGSKIRKRRWQRGCESGGAAQFTEKVLGPARAPVHGC